MKHRSVVKRLRSVRTSAYLIGALLGIFSLGQLIPQKRLLRPQDIAAWRLDHTALYKTLDALGMLEIYTSPLALIVLSLFFLNLLFVFQARIAVVWKKCAIDMSGRLDADRSVAINVRGLEREDIIGRFRRLLKGLSFRTDNGRFLAVKHRFGPLGSVLFHLSFLLLLVGGLVLYYTRSAGTAFVAEGQHFSGDPGEFQSLRPSLLDSIPQMRFQVLDIVPRYVDGSPIDLEVDLLIANPSGPGRTERIRVNHPLAHEDTSMLIRRIDIAPVIRLEDVGRKHLYEYAAIILHVLENRVDSYQVPFTSYRIDFEFYPDYAVVDGLEMSRSVMLNNPVFRVSVKEDNTELFNGLIRPGESRDFGGLRFGIENILYWGDFLMVRERGGMLLWAGFILGITGLCWRFFFSRIEIRGEFSDDTVLVSFHGEQEWSFRKQWIEEQRLMMERAFKQEEH